MSKRAFTIIFSLIWLGTANHCFIQEALASKQMPADHSCCQSSRDSRQPNSSANSGNHDGCGDKICCALFAKTDRNTADLGTSIEQFLYQLSLPVSWELEIQINYRLTASVSSFAQVPPSSSAPRLFSLSLAPNAPPAQT